MTNIQKALELHNRGDLDEAEILYLKVLELTEDLNIKSDILQLLGTLNLQKNNYDESKKYLVSSLRINPTSPNALNNLGILERKINNEGKAKTLFKKNIKYNNVLDSYINIIEICIKNQEFEEASLICKDAIKKFPTNNNIQSSYAIVLNEIGEQEESVNLFEKIINRNSVNPDIFYNYAIVLFKVGNLKKSLFCLNKFVSLSPKKNTEVFLLRSQILEKLGNLTDAEKDLLLALDVDDLNIQVKCHLLSFYLDAKAYSKVKKYCLKFLKFEKNNYNINLFKTAMLLANTFMANWKSTNEYFSGTDKIEIKLNKILKPLEHLYITDDPGQILDFNKYYQKKYCNVKLKVNRNINSNVKNSKVKIGFFSGDFKNHAVAHLIKDLFSNFDKSKFEIYGFSFFKKNDKYRNEIKASFDKFYDLDNLNSQDILDLVFDNNLDVAVDLAGFTQYHETWLFAYQIAKIKINYLGYPGTMGSNFHDYLIADRHIIPGNLKKFYTEKIIYLPETYQPFSIKSFDKEKLLREDFNLPSKNFLVASFSRIEKVTPKIFEIWMKIIAQFEHVKLVLFSSNNEVIDNIKEFCKFKNFNFNKIIFAKHLPHLDHLKRLSLFDLYLDTHPYNSHTVLSDALFHSSLPAVSLVGRSFQSRVACSLLHYADLKECITYNSTDYQNKIIELIENKNQLDSLKLKLDKKRSALSNRMVKFTRDFESLILDTLNI